MIHRTHPPRKMIRHLITRRHRDPKPQTPRHSRHRRHDAQRLIHRPLCAAADRWGEVLGATVDVVAAEDVGDEHAVEVPAFEELREGGPVREGVEGGGFVERVPPEAR